MKFAIFLVANRSFMSKKSPKVIVAMSGGVDSSLSAVLLKKKGYDVVGVTMKLVEGSRCCDVEAVGHAAEVCKRYDIEHHVIDVSQEFDRVVVNYFISELAAARTPNPCVFCNRFLKFEQLFKIARKLGADKIATGHYARVRKGRDGEWSLLKGKDGEKDQSYYLCFLKEEWLSQILFPVGGYVKSEIYNLARKEGLDFLVQKKQSQDLCFVDDKLRRSFIEKRLDNRPGEIVDLEGCVLGEHDGVHHYTIGQRKGLQVSGGAGPYYVVGFDVRRGHVIVSSDSESDELYRSVVDLRHVNFVSGQPSEDLKVMAKIRYQQKLSRAILKIGTKGAHSAQTVHLDFTKPQRAVTKGQIAVFYQGEKCLGGGIIK